MAGRDLVLGTAQRVLVFDPAASMSGIAAAGVGRATLHRQFAHREDLLREIARRTLDRWAETQPAARTAKVIASDAPQWILACIGTW